MPGTVPCRLCGAGVTHCVAVSRTLILRECPVCRLIFVPDRDTLPATAEKERYDRHQNHGTDPAYRSYLATFARELGRIPLTAPRVLDYGAGPEFVLSRILREHGIESWPYDPLYNLPLPREKAPFDIIAGCEVIEHLRQPAAEFAAMRTLLTPAGYAIFRTELFDATTNFTTWWYANDRTHINFYCRRTLDHVAYLMGRHVVYCDDHRIVIIGP